MKRAKPQRPTTLKPRAKPRQDRSMESVERFLDATAELLAETGFEAVTTNAIAERAGVNISSLYKYFPNKYAVISALAERTGKRRLVLVEHALQDVGERADWRDLTGVAIRELARQMRREVGALELERAIKAAPELRQVNGRTSRKIVALLVKLFDSSPSFQGRRDQLEAAAYVVVEASGALALLAADAPVKSGLIVAEWERMIVSYVETYRE